MKVFFLAAIFVFAVVLQLGTGMKACKKPTTVGVDEEFLKAAKFHIPLHSKCDNCEAGDKNWTMFKGRSKAKTLCYKMGGVNDDGDTFEADFRCEYVIAGEGSCVLKTKVPPFLSGTMFLTKTDNKTYMAGATCIFGRENWWWVASIEESISSKLKREIIDDFVDNKGFKRDNVAELGKHELVFTHLTFEDREDC